MSQIRPFLIPGIKTIAKFQPGWAWSIPSALAASVALLVVWLAAACGTAAAPDQTSGQTISPTPTPAQSPATPTPAPRPDLNVVATTALLADLARNVGGDRVTVRSLVPPGVDEHSYQTTPQDSITVGQAAVIISNGFGLDDFLAPVLAGARQVGAVHVVASEGLEAAPVVEHQFPGEGDHDEHLLEEIEALTHHAQEGEISAQDALAQVQALLDSQELHEEEPDEHEAEGRELVEQIEELVHQAEAGQLSPLAALEAIQELVEQSHQEEHGHAHSAGDPHFWQNPIFAIHYVERIRDGLALADPEHAPVYAANADAYIQLLRELDQEIALTLESVPPEHRHLVTFHDAFGYFASRYEWQVSAFAASDASEVTPGAVVAVMQRIREEGIPAVFAEPQFSPALLQQAARDTGVAVGIVYAQPTGDVPTYIDMMRANARALAEHLR